MADDGGPLPGLGLTDPRFPRFHAIDPIQKMIPGRGETSGSRI